MTITEAIQKSAALTGAGGVVGTAEAVRRLSGYDGALARGFFRLDVWEPYDPQTDADTLLLVPQPWDGLYVHLLEALTYYAAGEYQRAENARVMEARLLAEFKAWVMRRYARPSPAVLAEINAAAA